MVGKGEHFVPRFFWNLVLKLTGGRDFPPGARTHTCACLLLLPTAIFLTRVLKPIFKIFSKVFQSVSLNRTLMTVLNWEDAAGVS